MQPSLLASALVLNNLLQQPVNPWLGTQDAHESVFNLKLSSYGMPQNLKDDLGIVLILGKLLEGKSATNLNLSTAPIPLMHFQSFIAKYKTSELNDMQKQIAEKIKSPELSKTQRQAELRCVLALVYLQQGRVDRACAQLKQAGKTPAFELREDFKDLYQHLKHPRKSLNP